MRVVILGSGQVGTQIVENLFVDNQLPDLDITLLTSKADDQSAINFLTGKWMDARHASISKGPPPKINFTDYRDEDQTISAYSEADLIIIAAGEKLPLKRKLNIKSWIRPAVLVNRWPTTILLKIIVS
jgi:malate/lactate dehydrogenase